VLDLEENLPHAIVVISPHWQTEEVVVSSSRQNGFRHSYEELMTEYGGLPCPPGSPEIASRILRLLEDGGVQCRADETAGIDDAVVGPIALMFPQADVPVVTMSILASLDAEDHVRIGQLLQPLCTEGVFFLGVGLSSNTLDCLEVSCDPLVRAASSVFQEHLDITVTQERGNVASRALLGWETWPCARVNHPTEEHLMPLLVVTAAAGDAKGAKIDTSFNGMPLSNYVFDAM
jgi:aromatic ring-opening dioxygenase catalytic subunit (LigB family)